MGFSLTSASSPSDVATREHTCENVSTHGSRLASGRGSLLLRGEATDGDRTADELGVPGLRVSSHRCSAASPASLRSAEAPARQRTTCILPRFQNKTTSVETRFADPEDV